MAIKITGPIGAGGGGAGVSSVNGQSGVVNLYASDATLNLAGDGIVVNGSGVGSTLDVDSGTTANKIVKLDGSARLPAVDGTQLTALNVVVDTTPQLGGDLDVNGQSIVSASAGDIAITPDTTGSIVLDGLSWPQADGTTGQVLKTDGAGNLGWVTAAGGLSAVVDDTTPQLGGDLDVNGQSIVSASAGNIAITPDTTGSIVLDGQNWPQADGTTGQVLSTNGAGQLSWTTPTTGLQDVVDDTTPQLGGNLDVNGQSIVSVSAGDIAITPDTTGSIVLDGQNWPQADGTTGQILQTNGAGQLSWTTPTTGLQDVVDDTTPQLGGALDVNGQSIVSVSAGNIVITPDTTGSIVLDGLNWPQADGTTNQVLKTDGAGNLGWITAAGGLTAVVDDTTPQLGGALDVNGQSIVSVSAGDIAITPDTTGSIVLDGLNWPQADGTTGQVLKTDGAGNLGWVTAAGGLSAVVDDTTPQLGGALDVNGQSIVSASAGNIAITPDTTGSIVLDGLNWPQADGTTGQVIQTNGAGQLSFVDQSGLQDVVDDTTPQLGGNLDVNGQSIVSASAGNIAITPDTTGSIVLDGQNWPQADGTTGQVLQTNGAGQLSWTTPTTGLQDVVDDTTPQLGGNLDVNGQSIVSASAGNIAITPDTTGSIVLDGLSWPQADGTTGQVLQTNGAGQLSFTNPTSGLANVVDDTTPQLGGNLDVNGQAIVSASAGNIAITPDTTGSIVLDGLSWPQADGTTGQYLSTNGSGQLSWATAAGASRPTVTTDSSGTDSTISNPSAGTLEDIYLIDNGASAVTITLPTVTSNSGYKVQVKRLGTANVTVLAAGSATIDDGSSTTKVLTIQYSSLTLCTDGTDWYII
jgi:hypothetical protein